MFGGPGEGKCSGQEGVLEGMEEFTAEELRQGPDGHEEVGLGCDPATAGQIEASCGDNHMEVGMVVEFLVPGMKDSREADLSTKTLPAFGKLE
jgi:hypothetical protein